MTKSIRYAYCNWRRVVAKFSSTNWGLKIRQALQCQLQVSIFFQILFCWYHYRIVMQMSVVSFTFNVLPLSQSYILTFIHEHLNRLSCSVYLLNKIFPVSVFFFVIRWHLEPLGMMKISFSRPWIYFAIQLLAEFPEAELVSMGPGPSLLAAPPRRNWNSILAHPHVPELTSEVSKALSYKLGVNLSRFQSKAPFLYFSSCLMPCSLQWHGPITGILQFCRKTEETEDFFQLWYRGPILLTDLWSSHYGRVDTYWCCGFAVAHICCIIDSVDEDHIRRRYLLCASDMSQFSNNLVKFHGKANEVASFISFEFGNRSRRLVGRLTKPSYSVVLAFTTSIWSMWTFS